MPGVLVVGREFDGEPDRGGHPPHQLGLVVVIEGLAVGVGEVGGPALVLLEPEQGTGEIEQHGGMSHGESLVKTRRAGTGSRRQWPASE